MSQQLEEENQQDPEPEIIDLAGYLEVDSVVYLKPDSEEQLQKLQPLQKAGLNLAIVIGVLIIIVMIFVGIDLYRNVPAKLILPPSTASSADIEAFGELVAVYRDYQDIVIDRTTKFFTLMVASTLVPVFTTILGYIFGTSQANNNSKELTN